MLQPVTSKSSESKIPRAPINCTSLSSPKDSADGIPARKIASPSSHDTGARRSGFLYASTATIFSSIENAEVSVANSTSTMNTTNSGTPSGNWANTAGKIAKISPGP